MIVWSGRGFLSVIVLVVTLFLCVLILPDGYSDYGFVITAFVTGFFSWFFGKKWNLQGEQIVVDEKTGQRLKIKNNHTLFWIPMQYWGVIFPVIGIIISFQNSVLLGVISLIVLLVFIVVPLMNRKPKLKSEKSFAKKTTYSEKRKKTEITNEISEEEQRQLELEKAKIKKEKEDPSRFMPK